MIDLDQIGPDWELAKLHAKTTIAGKASGDINEVQRCPCCFRKVITQPISIFSNSKELQVLGFAFPLYFKFLKYAIILVLFQICSYNLVELLESVNENRLACQSGQEQSSSTICNSIFVELASLNALISETQTIRRVGSFVIQLFLLVYIRHKMTNTLAYYKERKTSITNFAILIKDLPQVLGMRAKLSRLFKQFFFREYQVEDMMLIGYLEQYYHLKQRKNKLINEKINLMTKEEVEQVIIAEYQLEIQQVERLIEEEIEKTIASTKKDQLLCQKVIIIVENQPAKLSIIKEFEEAINSRSKRHILEQIFGTKDVSQIRMIEAPEPEEIIWEHINVPRRKRRLKLVFGWTLTVVFMAAVTAIFYFIIRQKSLTVQHLLQQIKNGDIENVETLQTRANALIYFFTFFTILLNKIVVSQFLHFVTDIEKHSTFAKEEYFFSLKYTLTLFLTTAVLALLVQDATLHNIYHQEHGLIQEETLMFILSATFVPFFWLVNPFQVYRVIKRKMNVNKVHQTQREANTLMMDSPASLGKLFAETIEIIWFTYMYSSVIPIGGLIIFAGFIINYWIVKHNILRRSGIQHEVSGNFIMMALKLLDISLIMKPIGELIFDFQIRDSYTVQSIVCAAIGLLYCMLPMNWILSKVHKQDFLLEQKNYVQVKQIFATNYKMLHPIYSLRKIFVEKEVEKLNIVIPGEGNLKRPTKKLAINIELALLRRSSQFKLESQLAKKRQTVHVEEVIRESIQKESIHERIL